MLKIQIRGFEFRFQGTVPIPIETWDLQLLLQLKFQAQYGRKLTQWRNIGNVNLHITSSQNSSDIHSVLKCVLLCCSIYIPCNGLWWRGKWSLPTEMGWARDHHFCEWRELMSQMICGNFDFHVWKMPCCITLKVQGKDIEMNTVLSSRVHQRSISNLYADLIISGTCCPLAEPRYRWTATRIMMQQYRTNAERRRTTRYYVQTIPYAVGDGCYVW